MVKPTGHWNYLILQYGLGNILYIPEIVLHAIKFAYHQHHIIRPLRIFI